MSVSLSLAGSWLAASAVALAFAALATAAGSERAGFAAFLVIAPLVPMAGVALAFGPGLDPTYQITVAAPVSTARIVMLRSLAVVGAALPVIVALSVALPGWSALAFAWLLPALGVGRCQPRPGDRDARRPSRGRPRPRSGWRARCSGWRGRRGRAPRHSSRASRPSVRGSGSCSPSSRRRRWRSWRPAEQPSRP